MNHLENENKNSSGVTVESPRPAPEGLSVEYQEDAECLPSVHQLRADRQYWIRLFYSHSGVHWDGKSELALEDQVRLLKAAIEPGCPNYPDLGYYLRHAAYGFAENQRRWRAEHHEYQTLITIIHRQREELARLNGQVKGLARLNTPERDAETVQG